MNWLRNRNKSSRRSTPDWWLSAEPPTTANCTESPATFFHQKSAEHLDDVRIQHSLCQYYVMVLVLQLGRASVLALVLMW